MKYKITHLTSAHPRYDTRIFIKECNSLAKIENYEVSLIVADGKGNEVKGAIYIYDVGRLQGRVNRIFKTTKEVFKKAIELKPKDSRAYNGLGNSYPFLKQYDNAIKNYKKAI